MLLMAPTEKPFENIEGKGENAGNQHFLLFPQCFLPLLKQIPIFQPHSTCCLQVFSIWNSLKNLLCGKDLTLSRTSPGFYVSVV